MLAFFFPFFPGAIRAAGALAFPGHILMYAPGDSLRRRLPATRMASGKRCPATNRMIQQMNCLVLIM
ncbi:hypothetical protein DYH52_17685 [Morganella morganii]|nr:hypothetical protein C1O70_17350 [Morganella morganii]AUT99532.1 hypothetical protein MC49_004765 [Morganella morganii]AVD58260.1 hypothetical protein C4E49_01890 [Morganella morganii]REL17658.1 hypothetical protein DYH52_17685 [Morganella morganii]